MTASPPGPDFTARLERARTEMTADGVDALVVSVGSDLPYLLGYEAVANERLTMAVITPAGATLFVPGLEEPRVMRRGELFDVVAWEETEDPLDLVAARIVGAGRVATGAQTWSRFLLGLQDRLPGVRFVDATGIMRRLRVVKDGVELALLQTAAAAADRVAEGLAGEQFSGRTERELARFIAAETVAAGHETSSFAIVASGPNAASPHHEPGDRIIAAGDAVVADFGGRVGGYASDITRTFHVGEPAPEFSAAYDVLVEAQEAAVAAVAPGVVAEDVDRAAREVIGNAGYGAYFIHRTGHGIGLDVHEDPYLVAGNSEALGPGMAFSIEPGIYVPGRFGMRIEDIVAVDDGGSRRLNSAGRELRVVG